MLIRSRSVKVEEIRDFVFERFGLRFLSLNSALIGILLLRLSLVVVICSSLHCSPRIWRLLSCWRCCLPSYWSRCLPSRRRCCWLWLTSEVKLFGHVIHFHSYRCSIRVRCSCENFKLVWVLVDFDMQMTVQLLVTCFCFWPQGCNDTTILEQLWKIVESFLKIRLRDGVIFLNVDRLFMQLSINCIVEVKGFDHHWHFCFDFVLDWLCVYNRTSLRRSKSTVVGLIQI